MATKKQWVVTTSPRAHASAPWSQATSNTKFWTRINQDSDRWRQVNPVLDRWSRGSGPGRWIRAEIWRQEIRSADGRGRLVLIETRIRSILVLRRQTGKMSRDTCLKGPFT